jgi:hypothetical protein
LECLVDPNIAAPLQFSRRIYDGLQLNQKDYVGSTQRYNFRTKCGAVYKAVAKMMATYNALQRLGNASAILPKVVIHTTSNKNFPNFLMLGRM